MGDGRARRGFGPAPRGPRRFVGRAPPDGDPTDELLGQRPKGRFRPPEGDGTDEMHASCSGSPTHHRRPRRVRDRVCSSPWIAHAPRSGVVSGRNASPPGAAPAPPKPDAPGVARGRAHLCARPHCHGAGRGDGGHSAATDQKGASPPTPRRRLTAGDPTRYLAGVQGARTQPALDGRRPAPPPGARAPPEPRLRPTRRRSSPAVPRGPVGVNARRRWRSRRRTPPPR